MIKTNALLKSILLAFALMAIVACDSHSKKLTISDTQLTTEITQDNFEEKMDEVRLHGDGANETDEFSFTLLHHVSMQKDPKSVENIEELVLRSADINAQTQDGNTPLHLAIAKGYTKNIQILLQKGADINILNNDNKSPVDFAKARKYKSLFDILVGADKNLDAARDDSGNRLAHDMSFAGNEEFLQKLIAMGANINIPNKYDNTPLHFAIITGHEHIIKILLDAGADIEAKNYNGITPLTWSLRGGGPLSVTKQLLQAGANIEARDKDDETALHWASFFAKPHFIQLLLEMGADIEARNNKGNTPLHIASMDEEAVMAVKVLLAAGANIEAKNNNDKTPLYLATTAGLGDIVDVLIAANAERIDANVADEYGNTPLYNAVRDGDYARVAELIKAGAEVNINISNDETTATPLNWALTRQHDALVDAMIDAGAYINGAIKGYNGATLLHLAIENDDVARVKKLLAAGADTEARTSFDNETMLHKASKQGNAEIVTMLLDMEAKLELKTKYGRTALAIAMHRNHTNIVKILLDAGARINFRVDGNGNTPLHWASVQQDAEILQKVLDAKPPLNSQDRKYGFTPLHRASAIGYIQNVSMLVDAGADITIKDTTGKRAVNYAQYLAIVDYLRAPSASSTIQKKTISRQQSNGDLNEKLMDALQVETLDAIALVKKHLSLGAEFDTYIALRHSLQDAYQAADDWTDGTEATIDEKDRADDIQQPRSSRSPYQDNDDYSYSAYYRTPVTYWLEELIARGYPASMLDVHRLLYPRYMKNAGIEDIKALLAQPEDNGQATDINMRDAMGRTPLYIADIQGNQAIFDYLKQNGADY